MRKLLRANGRVLFLALLLLFSRRVVAQQPSHPSPGGEKDFQFSIETFTKAYQLIEQNYADPLNPDAAIFGGDNSGRGAIPGMLRTLDPHSNFFDPRAYALLREQQQGRYFGVGMRIENTAGKEGRTETMVVESMPRSPAFRAGLRPGDVILRIDDRQIAGLDTSQVSALLKGPKGTTVRLAVSREGVDHALDFALVRDEIASPTVDGAFLIRSHVAYLHISGFSETTDQELTAALERLNPKSLQGLVLDLRDNPGGLLEQAVQVADHFLRKNQVIVSQSGRNSQEMRYVATTGDGGVEYPIVVLINRMTASAAEIVTGALQDHDRALVMGEPSFGKGLVQTVYPLSDDTGLALTTAHYYTPSGRLIQRDYANISLYDYYYHYDGNDGINSPRTQVRLTDGGREVYGGGGIMPDVMIPRVQLNPTQQMLEQREAFFKFGRHYLATHPAVSREFVPDAQTVKDFNRFLADQGIAVNPQDLDANREYIAHQIREQVVGILYGSDAAGEIAVGFDPLVQTAVENLDRARQLTASAKRYVASKREPAAGAAPALASQ